MSIGPHSTETGESAVLGTVFDESAAEASHAYAEALVNAAARDGQIDAALDELDEIRDDVLRPFPKFAALITSPSVPVHDRDRMLAQTFEGRALPTVVNFLRVLNRHGRMALLEPIIKEARAIWDRRQNRRPVTVRSAVPLDEGQQATLRDRLGAMLQATPILRFEVDPALIGGLVVQAEDEVFDASIRSRLAQLRRRLVEGKSGATRSFYQD